MHVHRLEHSLGVGHLAYRMADSIHRMQKDELDVTRSDVKCAEVAGDKSLTDFFITCSREFAMTCTLKGIIFPKRLLMRAAFQNGSCFAGLVHDLGHGPYSHVFDRVMSRLGREW